MKIRTTLIAAGFLTASLAQAQDSPLSVSGFGGTLDFADLGEGRLHRTVRATWSGKSDEAKRFIAAYGQRYDYLHKWYTEEYARRRKARANDPNRKHDALYPSIQTWERAYLGFSSPRASPDFATATDTNAVAQHAYALRPGYLVGDTHESSAYWRSYGPTVLKALESIKAGKSLNGLDAQGGVLEEFLRGVDCYEATRQYGLMALLCASYPEGPWVNVPMESYYAPSLNFLRSAAITRYNPSALEACPEGVVFANWCLRFGDIESPSPENILGANTATFEEDERFTVARRSDWTALRMAVFGVSRENVEETIPTAVSGLALPEGSAWVTKFGGVIYALHVNWLYLHFAERWRAANDAGIVPFFPFTLEERAAFKGEGIDELAEVTAALLEGPWPAEVERRILKQAKPESVRASLLCLLRPEHVPLALKSVFWDIYPCLERAPINRQSSTGTPDAREIPWGPRSNVFVRSLDTLAWVRDGLAPSAQNALNQHEFRWDKTDVREVVLYEGSKNQQTIYLVHGLKDPKLEDGPHAVLAWRNWVEAVVRHLDENGATYKILEESLPVDLHDILVAASPQGRGDIADVIGVTESSLRGLLGASLGFVELGELVETSRGKPEKEWKRYINMMAHLFKKPKGRGDTAFFHSLAVHPSVGYVAPTTTVPRIVLLVDRELEVGFRSARTPDYQRPSDVALAEGLAEVPVEMFRSFSEEGQLKLLEAPEKIVYDAKKYTERVVERTEGIITKTEVVGESVATYLGKHARSEAVRARIRAVFPKEK